MAPKDLVGSVSSDRPRCVGVCRKLLESYCRCLPQLMAHASAVRSMGCGECFGECFGEPPCIKLGMLTAPRCVAASGHWAAQDAP